MASPELLAVLNPSTGEEIGRIPAGDPEAVWGGAPGGAAQPQGRSGLGFGYGPELLDEVTFTKVSTTSLRSSHAPPAGPPSA